MYSYDRRIKVARRNLGDAIESVQASIPLAQEAVKLANQYIRQAGDFYQFLQVTPDFNDIKTFLGTATKIARDLPLLLEEADKLDNALDAYARTTRRGMPRNRDEIDSSELDQGMLKAINARATPLAAKFTALSQLATDAPIGFEIDDAYDSPRVAAINALVPRLEELSTEMTFDESEIVSFLEDVENLLVEYINRGPS